jgi:nucleoside-diphosphate-sugar epimerase
VHHRSFKSAALARAAQYHGSQRPWWSNSNIRIPLRRVGALPQGDRDLQVLLLGGTGVIGSAVVRELIARGHDVLGLARSEASAARLAGFGATPLRGDIGSPEAWTGRLPEIDAVIHAACDFDSDMAAIDRCLLDHLLPDLGAQANGPRFIYTGGCWLFGATDDAIAAEETALDPLPAFAWMVPHLARVLAAREVDGIVIHPAMVYTADGGVFDRFAREAIERSVVRVVGNENVRWPLVHTDDLAMLYALALERAPARSVYIGAANDGVAVGRIARAFARRFGARKREPEIISADAAAAEWGEWARGYARDQRLSGAKAQRELGWQPRHLDVEYEIRRQAVGVAT